jgi:sirohydrochlorin ferrochelatase
MSLLAGIATFEALYRRLMSPFQRPVPILPLPTDKTICFLVDNGSLRAASFRNLRKAARLVQEKLGDSVAAVVPVSIRFSDRVPLKRLDGVAGEVLVDAIQRAIEAGYTSFIIVPFFIGPSSQLTDTIPDMLMPIAREFPAITLRLATSLMDPFLYPSDRRLALALAARVTSAAAEHSLNPASVPVYCALIDHGSPSQ